MALSVLQTVPVLRIFSFNEDIPVAGALARAPRGEQRDPDSRVW
jgi:hypothetical protein